MGIGRWFEYGIPLGLSLFTLALTCMKGEWVHVGVCLVICGFLFWLVYRACKETSDIAAKVRAQALSCPFCGERLPPWDGVFRDEPNNPDCVLSVESFRVRCHRCQRDVWFLADFDGRVTYAEWRDPARDKQPPPGGVIVNLDEL